MLLAGPAVEVVAGLAMVVGGPLAYPVCLVTSREVFGLVVHGNIVAVVAGAISPLALLLRGGLAVGFVAVRPVGTRPGT